MNSDQTSGTLPVGRALWKLERCLTWYGLKTLHIGAVELTPDGRLLAEVSSIEDGSKMQATIDRQTGRLCLDRASELSNAA